LNGSLIFFDLLRGVDFFDLASSLADSSFEPSPLLEAAELPEDFGGSSARRVVLTPNAMRRTKQNRVTSRSFMAASIMAVN